MAQDAAESPGKVVDMLVNPGFTALDLIGPQYLLSFMPGRTTQFLWKTGDIVVSDSGVPIQPTMTIGEAPESIDFIVVPGGTDGTVAAMNDAEVLAFLASRGELADYVTSVSTGSLVFGAAGLSRGYRATSHWSARELLPLFGAEPVPDRVVVDRNRVTGAGVTAGIDFGPTVLAQLKGEEYAKLSQLAIEYGPQPPFKAGNPESAGPTNMSHMNELYAPFLASAEKAIRSAPGYVGPVAS